MDSGSSSTDLPRVVDTVSAGALSRVSARDLPGAHTSRGSWPPVPIVSTTPMDLPLSPERDLGTSNPPPWSEPSQPASRNPRQATESRPLALEESWQLLMRKVTGTHQISSNPSQTLELPRQVVTKPAQRSPLSVNRTSHDSAKQDVYPQQFVIDHILGHSYQPKDSYNTITDVTAFYH